MTFQKQAVQCLVALMILMSAEPAEAQVSTASNSEKIADIIAFQKDFIARFTGEIPYDGDKVLKGRTREKHRSIAAKILMQEVTDLGFVPVARPFRVKPFGSFGRRIKTADKGINILFELPPTTALEAEYIVLVAHYDAVPGAPGADDNASGVATLLQVARTLKTLPERNLGIIFILADLEETGLIGSGGAVNDLAALNVNVNVHSVHSYDMLGWDGDGDNAVELDPGSDEIEAIYRKHACELGIFVKTISTNRSDHAAFRAAGHVATLMIEEFTGGDFNPHYHSSKDSIKYIDFDYLASNTELVTSVIAELVIGTESKAEPFEFECASDT